MESNPYTNWRWWASVPVMLILVPVRCALIITKGIGDIADELDDIIVIHSFKPFLRWIWGGSHD